MAGGVWCVVDDGRARFGYCGDVVPASPVFAMDPLPRCDAIVLDASYGDDDVNAQQRAKEVRDWVAAHRDGCVLPTPLNGRSAELLAIVPGRDRVAPGMRRRACSSRSPIRAWLADGRPSGFRNGSTRRRLADRRAAAARRTALPRRHGHRRSVARSSCEQAAARGHPMLFTGHVPADSPGERMLARRPGGVDSVADASDARRRTSRSPRPARRAIVLGHSCERAALERLTRHIPRLRADLATGDRLEL